MNDELSALRGRDGGGKAHLHAEAALTAASTMATSCDFADYPQSTCKTRKSEYLGGSFP